VREEGAVQARGRAANKATLHRRARAYEVRSVAGAAPAAADATSTSFGRYPVKRPKEDCSPMHSPPKAPKPVAHHIEGTMRMGRPTTYPKGALAPTAAAIVVQSLRRNAAIVFATEGSRSRTGYGGGLVGYPMARG
jgi:hypothetical protein